MCVLYTCEHPVQQSNSRIGYRALGPFSCPQIVFSSENTVALAHCLQQVTSRPTADQSHSSSKSDDSDQGSHGNKISLLRMALCRNLARANLEEIEQGLAWLSLSLSLSPPLSVSFPPSSLVPLFELFTSTSLTWNVYMYVLLVVYRYH